MNNNIEEPRVSLEIAKLLWKKGMKSPQCLLDKWLNINFKPTHALAIMWIRENFNIDIEITTYRFHGKYVGKRYTHLIYKTPNTEEGETEALHEENSVDTHEEAESAAITYCLTHLIK